LFFTFSFFLFYFLLNFFFPIFYFLYLPLLVFYFIPFSDFCFYFFLSFPLLVFIFFFNFLFTQRRRVLLNSARQRHDVPAVFAGFFLALPIQFKISSATLGALLYVRGMKVLPSVFAVPVNVGGMKFFFA